MQIVLSKGAAGRSAGRWQFNRTIQSAQLAPGLVTRTSQRQFHSPVLRLAFCRVIRGYGVRVAEPLRRD